MDIERGNIKIAFQKIPYTYILSHGEQSYETCAYNRIDKNVYLKYAAEVFDNASIDERTKCVSNGCFACFENALFRWRRNRMSV